MHENDWDLMTTARVLSWSSQLETGLPDVDSQHQRLIDIINELGRMHAEGATVEELLIVFAELRNYTVYHFQHEADLMESLPVNEANKAAHLRAHQAFVDRIEKAGELITTYPDAVVDNLLAFLVKWLVHHITGVDARMAREIIALRSGDAGRQNGIAESPLHEALVDTVSDLYDSLGTRTFEMLELNRQLQAYHDKQEEENALTHDIITGLVQREELSNSKLHLWFSPAAIFSGDIVAAVHGTKGRFYALMADATGHGLVAAITALPVLSVFYALAERGCPVGEILAEINRNLRAVLPTGRFVAATMTYIDCVERTAEVWNGGMPELLLLGPDGRLMRTLVSSQLPLGIVDFNAETSATTQISWEAGSQFVMYSDGLIEATNTAGEPFGVERLKKAVLAASADQRIAAVKAAFASHVGAAVPHDDISLMLVDCKNS